MFRFCANVLSGSIPQTRVAFLMTVLAVAAGVAAAGTISGNVADFNAAKVTAVDS